MATENVGAIVSKVAETNVTNMRFVKVGTKSDMVSRTTVNTERSCGVVAMISAGFKGTVIAPGDAVPVCESGTVIMEAGGAIADGAEVMSDGSGRPVTFVAGGGALALGVATNGATAGAAGDEIAIRLYALSEQHT